VTLKFAVWLLGRQDPDSNSREIRQKATPRLARILIRVQSFAKRRNRVKARISSFVCAILLGIFGFPGRASAAPFVLSQADFAGDPVIDFGTIQTLLPINGVTIGGVTFGFTVGGFPSLDAVIDDGPGNTNHITVANIEGNAAGALSLLFSAPVQAMGYGYAVSAPIAPIALQATTVELFDALNNSLGSLSFNASPDPLFSGGFAGIGNNTPFARAQVTFSQALGPSRFAFDNLTYGDLPSSVPEPATLLLTSVGLASIFAKRRWGRQTFRK
jgi:hypothetical protein